MAKQAPRLSPEEIQRVIATAWDDKPPFRRVLVEHGIERVGLWSLRNSVPHVSVAARAQPAAPEPRPW